MDNLLCLMNHVRSLHFDQRVPTAPRGKRARLRAEGRPGGSVSAQFEQLWTHVHNELSAMAPDANIGAQPPANCNFHAEKFWTAPRRTKLAFVATDSMGLACCVPASSIAVERPFSRMKQFDSDKANYKAETLGRRSGAN